MGNYRRRYRRWKLHRFCAALRAIRHAVSRPPIYELRTAVRFDLHAVGWNPWNWPWCFYPALAMLWEFDCESSHYPRTDICCSDHQLALGIKLPIHRCRPDRRDSLHTIARWFDDLHDLECETRVRQKQLAPKFQVSVSEEDLSSVALTRCVNRRQRTQRLAKQGHDGH